MSTRLHTTEAVNGFAIRGVVEGFYGAAYTQPQREDLLRFLGEHGFNTYIYGPKNDRKHRARWREPYGDEAMLDFRDSVTVAARAGIEFVYALSPGLDVRYGSGNDFAAITAKFTALLGAGVRRFSLFLDDINPTFRHLEDSSKFASFASAQADLCNRTLAWLREQRADAQLSMCPTIYHGAPPFGDYLHELGERLHPEIDVYYTGIDVCSRTIDALEVRAFASTLRRQPILWDNYPVNDGGMASELHIGPLRGRAPDLVDCAKGFAANPMNQPEASKVALHTFGAYFRDPVGYDPDNAWRPALTAVAGAQQAAAFESFASTSLHGALGVEPAPLLKPLVVAACHHLRGASDKEAAAGTSGHPLRDLGANLDELDEACYDLKFHLRNLALRAELLPWLEAMENWLWSGRRALELVAASVAGDDVGPALRRLKEPFASARAHHKRSGGSELLPFIDLALERHALASA